MKQVSLSIARVIIIVYNHRMTLTVLDYIIITFALVCSIWASIRGFIDEISSKFGYLLGLVVSLMFTKALTVLIVENSGLPYLLCSFVSYVALFIVGFYLMKFLGYMLKTIADSAHIGSLDNVLGFILGLAEAVLIVGLIETLLKNQSLIDVRSYLRSSYLSSEFIGPVFTRVSLWIEGLVR